MNIGIVTQPLLANYGGVLQNFALQKVLKQLGHTPYTIDYIYKRSILRFLLSFSKLLLLWLIPSKKRPFSSLKLVKRNIYVHDFIKKNISLTRIVHSYSSSIISQYNLGAVITGSDQVWRPMYNVGRLEDMFLKFVTQTNIKKIAYAASFGVDYWEYNDKQTKECSKLIKEFCGVSVRENSGITLCKEHLGVSAVEVLDPTLLLEKKDYEIVCKNIEKDNEPYLAAYILDMNKEKKTYLEKLSKDKCLNLKIFGADNDMILSIEQWLALYRDATFVITDSFHGTVFSIIFNIPFISIANSKRGISRFESLLSIFNLKNRIWNTNIEFNQFIVDDRIDWMNVNQIRSSLQKKSIDYIISSLK